MACKIGYFTHEGLPKKILETNVCAICGDHLQNLSNHVATGDEDDGDSGTEEKTFTLSCNHIFHESCIRGWIVLGKFILKYLKIYCLNFRQTTNVSLLQRKGRSATNVQESMVQTASGNYFWHYLKHLLF
jgi:hypothetical protein